MNIQRSARAAAGLDGAFWAPWAFALCALWTALAEPATAAEGCAACEPDRFMDAAELELFAALHRELEDGDLPRDRAEQFVVAAEEEAAAGASAHALELARVAAAECVVEGRTGCSPTLLLLARLTLAVGAGDPAREGEALAFLSFLPYEGLGSDECLEAVQLRYRLAERRDPRSVRAEWSDACGPRGRIGEVGYRAAKAALIRGELDAAKVRLERLRTFADARYQIRAAYLLAVLAVREGRLGAARDAFEDLVAVAPEPYRHEDEDDARTLAALQLARVERERGNFEAALDAYRGVPPASTARPEALLEAAVTAAHLGDLGAAKNFLDALGARDDSEAESLEMHRVRASLAMIDEDDAGARAAFKLLSERGRAVRSEIFTDDGRLKRPLAEDPGMGGLVDRGEGQRLVDLEREVAALEAGLEANQAALSRLETALAGGGGGPLERALRRLDEADALLRRAENLVAAREAAGVRVAGPAPTAREVAERALRLRAGLDAARARIVARKAARDANIQRTLGQIHGELDAVRVALAPLEGDVAEVARAGHDALVERALSVLHRLEMSEEVGDVELAWRAKERASLSARRVHQEHAEATATLNSDHDVE